GGGQSRQGFIVGALGDQVDAAADAAVGRDAAHQCAGSLQDLDPFDHFHGDAVGREQAVQAVHAGVAGGDAKAPDGEVFAKAAGGGGGAHGGIVGDHVGQRPGLDVLQHLGGVVHRAEGRI